MIIARALLATPLLGRLLRALAGAPRPVADPDETNRVAEAVDYLEQTAERRLGGWPLRIVSDDRMPPGVATLGGVVIRGLEDSR